MMRHGKGFAQQILIAIDDIEGRKQGRGSMALQIQALDRTAPLLPLRPGLLPWLASKITEHFRATLWGVEPERTNDPGLA
jgi:hypothetical protein